MDTLPTYCDQRHSYPVSNSNDLAKKKKKNKTERSEFISEYFT